MRAASALRPSAAPLEQYILLFSFFNFVPYCCTIARWLLGAGLLFAGVGHLTFARESFVAQVPGWLPLPVDVVVVASGVVAILLGLALIVFPRRRVLVGWITAAFFIAIFPGNVEQLSAAPTRLGSTPTSRAASVWSSNPCSWSGRCGRPGRGERGEADATDRPTRISIMRRTMFTVTESVLIARSSAEVFDFFTDGRNRPRWDTTVVFEKLTSPEPVRVGSTIHTRVRTMGRESDFDWRVTMFDRPTRMAIVSTAGLLPTSVLFAFSAAGDGCHASATIDGRPTGMLRVVEPMIAESVRSTLAIGLVRAKALLEERTL